MIDFIDIPQDIELTKRVQRARGIDKLLGQARMAAEMTFVGSPQHADFYKLWDQSEEAWQRVHGRVEELKGFCADLRQKLVNGAE